MLETFEAIQTKFNATAALTAIFAQGCYSTTDARKRPLPVCTVKITTGQRAKDTSLIARVTDRVQFQVWATYGNTAVEAVDAIVAAFDEAALTMANGCAFLRCSFMDSSVDITPDDDGVWQGDVLFALEYFADTQ
jgi:hypothetical protein